MWYLIFSRLIIYLINLLNVSTGLLVLEIFIRVRSAMDVEMFEAGLEPALLAWSLRARAMETKLCRKSEKSTVFKDTGM